MKKFILFFFPLFLLFTASLNAQLYNSWKWMHQSPQGNELRWVKMWNANTFYAIGAKGTFIKTTNRGVNWTFHHISGRMSGIPLQRANLLNAWFFDPNTGIVTGTYGSIFRTTNGGVTFDSVPGNPAPVNATITGIYFINNLTGYVISGQTGYRLMKSTDGGLNWNAGFGTAPPYPNPYELYAFNENKLLVLNSLGDVCISTNGGYLWNTYISGTLVNLYKVAFTDANTGFVCGDWGRCRYTTDGGYNWINMSGVLFDRNIHFFDIKYRNGAVYLTGNSNYLWRSSNYGATWDSISFIAPASVLPWSNYYYSSDFSVTGDTMITVGANGSMYQCLGPSNKITHSRNLKKGSMRCVWSSPGFGTVIAAGAASIPGTTHDQIMISSNGGVNWSLSAFSPTSIAEFYGIDMINQNTGFICGSRSAVYKTTNAGVSWDSLVIPNMPAGLTLSCIDFVDSQTGWVFSRTAVTGDSTIFKTTNGGVNWFRQKLGPNTGTSYLIYNASMIDANTGWVLNNRPRPCRTTDGGTTWDSTALGDNYLAGSLYDIEMYNALTGYCVGSNNRVYKTTNGGATPWSNVSYTSTTIITNYSVEVLSPLECAVLGTYGTVYVTTNGGSGWTNQSLLSSIDDIYGSYLTSDRKLFAVCALNSCIFMEYAFLLGINNLSSTIPDKFALKQNYPNPFNPSTVIRFQLSVAGNASLKVYDLLGREITTLVNESLQPGTYEVRFDAKELSSGIYLYTLRTDNFSETKKMVLIR